MRKFVCELGGYETLLHGNVNDAKRAVVARTDDHALVRIHDPRLQRALDHMAEAWRRGWLFWGRDLARDAVHDWFHRKRYEVNVGGTTITVPLRVAGKLRERVSELKEKQ